MFVSDFGLLRWPGGPGPPGTFLVLRSHPSIGSVEGPPARLPSVRVRTFELRLIGVALVVCWTLTAALVLLAYRPGGPIDVLVGVLAFVPLGNRTSSAWSGRRSSTAVARSPPWSGSGSSRCSCSCRPLSDSSCSSAHSGRRRCCPHSRPPTRGFSRSPPRACSPASGSRDGSSGRPRCAAAGSSAGSWWPPD